MEFVNRYSLSCLLMVLLVANGCDKKGQGKSAVTGKPSGSVADKTVILATIAADEQPQSGVPSPGMGMHTPQSASFQPQYSKRGGGVAYVAEKNGKEYVVHNGRAGKQYDAVGAIALSPDGVRIAYGVLVDKKWRMSIDGKEGAAYSTVKSPLFSPDGNHLAYQAMAGEKWYLVMDTNANAGTPMRLLDHQFSADSARIAYIDNADDTNRGQLVVSDLGFARQTTVSPGVTKMFVNQDASRIAAIRFAENMQRIVECSFSRPDVVKAWPLYDVIHDPAFGPDGASLAFAAEREGRSLMVLNDREEELPAGSLMEPPVIRPDRKVVGSIMTTGAAWFLHESFIPGKKNKEYKEASGLVFSRDSAAWAFAARKGNNWFVVVNGTEGPAFDRVVSPKFSPNGKSLVYRARKDGKRFVVVADTTGKTVKIHPSYEQVFDVEFTADGKSIAYGVRDGRKLVWQVEAL